MAAAVYMARVTSRKLHCDVMKTKYSWRHSKFFQYNSQTSGMFLLSQHLYCDFSAQLEYIFGLFILKKKNNIFGMIFLLMRKVYKFDKK